MNRREFLTSTCACLGIAVAKIGPALGAAAPPSIEMSKVGRCGTLPPSPSDMIQTRRVTEALRAHRVSFNHKTIIRQSVG